MLSGWLGPLSRNNTWGALSGSATGYAPQVLLRWSCRNCGIQAWRGEQGTLPPVRNVVDALPRQVGGRVYYGWVVLGVAMIGMFASAPGQTYTFSVFIASLRGDLGLSSTLISSLYLVGTITASVLIIPVGKALDIFGGRIMLVAAGLAVGMASIWMSQIAGAIGLLVGFVVLRTFGQGSLSLIPTTLVSIWFVRRRARALAIVGLGGAIAGGVFPLLSTGLIELFQWRRAWVAIAIIASGLLVVPAAIFVRRSPESVGLLPDGATGHATAQPQPFKDEEPSFTVRQAMRTRSLWLLMFASSAQSLVATGLMFHQVSLFAARGLSSTTAAAVFGVIAPAMVAGQFLSGFMASKFPLRCMVAVAQVPLAAAALLMLVIAVPWHSFFYGALLGLTVGFMMNSMMTIWPQYYGRANLGSIRGVTQFAIMAASAAGPLPLAIAFDTTGSFAGALALFAVLPIVCAAAAVAAVRPRPPRPE